MLWPLRALTAVKVCADPNFGAEPGQMGEDACGAMSETSHVGDRVEQQIVKATAHSQKHYAFNEDHDASQPAMRWFQDSVEGRVLFVVFYTQACRWSLCLGCNLPAMMSRRKVDFRALMTQIDCLFADPEVVRETKRLRKVIVSNNGSVLDEQTFSSTALVYLVARLNQCCPELAVVALETRVEYVDEAELEFLARALKEGATPTALELAIGFEAFDDHIRNEVFRKGLTLHEFEHLCRRVARHQFRLKCYFMLKPVPGISDAEAVLDIHRAIDFLSAKAQQHQIQVNLHLNPTYVAYGTRLEVLFRRGEYQPPCLRDVARAAVHAEGKPVTVYLGLSDENLACEGGSFLRPGEEGQRELLDVFNRTQDFGLLRKVAAGG